MHAYITHEIIPYEIKVSYYISYMKSGYDIMISFSMISCVIYACMYDIIETKKLHNNSTTDTSTIDDLTL